MQLRLAYSTISDRRWIPTPLNDASIPYGTGYHLGIRKSLGVGLDLPCLLVGDVPAAQVGLLGHAKESSKLAEGSLSESLRKETCDIHISGNIANSE